MARLSTIDDNERRKYEEFNRRTYGTTLEASQNNRRRSNTGGPETASVRRQNQTTNSQTPAVNTETAPSYPQQRPARRRTTRRRRTYRPTRKDRRIKAKIPTGKKKISLAARWFIRLVSLGFLFIPQVFMTIVTLAALGAITALDSNIITRLVLELGGNLIEGTAMLAWFLMILMGWITIVIVLLVFLAIGARPLFGHQAGIKMSLFFTALVLYSIPVVNLIPWCFLWAEYVFHHPD